MYDITWLLRGAQSAVFYYASCSPYTRARNRRRRAKEVEEDRLARQDIDANIPGLYRQPSPYRRNEFWEEDIRMGPDRSDRNVRKKNRNKQPQRRPEMSTAVVAGDVGQIDCPREESNEGVTATEVVEKDVTAAETDVKSPDDKMRGIQESPERQGTATTQIEHAMDNMKNFVRNAAESGKQRWASMRYQRADEQLWGNEFRSANGSFAVHSHTSKASSVVGSSHGHRDLLHLPRLTKADTQASSAASTDNFFVPRNPPVNELHPPVVSQPIYSKAANSWMKQPPPPPSVMGGFTDPLSSSANPSFIDLPRRTSTRASNRADGLPTTAAASISAAHLTIPEAVHLRRSTSDTHLKSSKTRSSASSEDEPGPKTPISLSPIVDVSTVAHYDFALPAALHRSQTSAYTTNHKPRASKTLDYPQRSPETDTESGYYFKYPYPSDRLHSTPHWRQVSKMPTDAHADQHHVEDMDEEAWEDAQVDRRWSVDF